MPAAGETLAGRFLLGRVLGSGGSGVVFEARDLRLGQLVAVKVLHPGRIDAQSLERIRREVHAARGGHPHVAAVYDLHEADGLHFLSMELVEGESLRNRLRREERLPLDETIRIGAQIASALVHLHARGIVHRDVKPGNILLTPDGDAKLCDMGLARPVEEGVTVTEAATVVGTPAYMAPEQATGEELTAATDVYALGLTLYRMLAGIPPLVEATALSTLARRQKERPPSVRREAPDTPRWLARLLDRILDPNPRERPSAEAVERALAGGRFRFRPRRRTVAAAVVLVVAAVAVPGIYSQIRRGETVRFRVEGSSVFGLDSEGRTTWTRSLGSDETGIVRADFDGDGNEELAAVTDDLQSWRKDQRHFATVSIFDLHGHLLVSARLRDLIGNWCYSFPLRLVAGLQAVDLDEDGRSELLVLCRQAHFFPFELLVYWPARKEWQTVLEHPGYIRSITALPDAHRPVLRFVGLANRPIYAPVAGEIVLDPAGLGSSTLNDHLRLRPGARSVPGAFLAWYTILDPADAEFMGDTARLEVHEDGGSTIHGETGTVLRLDRWGNPEPGPNAGRNLGDLRCGFLREMGWLRTYTKSANVDSIKARVRTFRERFAPLLAEQPYRITLDVVEARCLARVGGVDEAIAVLTPTVRDTHSEDAVVLLANLLGIAGRLREAVAVLEPAVAMPGTQRVNFDGRLLLFQLAVALHDQPLAERCLFHFGVASRKIEWGEGTVAAILARAHLLWDEPTGTDCTVRSWPYEPAGAALACLCRWRLGRTAADDTELMRKGAEANPDAVAWFRVAEAAAQLGLGHPDTTVLLLDHLEPGLRQAATNDFGDHQLLGLARALRATALLASGDTTRARVQATALLHTLTPGLLPAKLAAEVLRATTPSTVPPGP